MTKIEISSLSQAALGFAGYDEARARPNYGFCDLTSSATFVRQISLTAFVGYLHGHRNGQGWDRIGGEPAAQLNRRREHAIMRDPFTKASGCKHAGYDLADLNN